MIVKSSIVQDLINCDVSEERKTIWFNIHTKEEYKKIRKNCSTLNWETTPTCRTPKINAYNLPSFINILIPHHEPASMSIVSTQLHMVSLPRQISNVVSASRGPGWFARRHCLPLYSQVSISFRHLYLTFARSYSERDLQANQLPG